MFAQPQGQRKWKLCFLLSVSEGSLEDYALDIIQGKGGQDLTYTRCLISRSTIINYLCIFT